MARLAASWNRIRNNFDPFEVLVGKRKESFYSEREHSQFNDILIDFRFNPDGRGDLPVGFLMGHRGSGKSSMLLSLLEQFKDKYFVVYFDVVHNLNVGDANQIDILYLLGTCIFKTALEEGIAPDPTSMQALAESVYTVTYQKKSDAKKASLNAVELAKGAISIGASLLGGPAAGQLADTLTKAFLSPFNLSSGVSEETAKKLEIKPKIGDITDNVNLIIADVEIRAGKPLLVIVDGLDKLQRLEQAKLIFLDNPALKGPKCRIIYTVPILLANSRLFKQVMEEGKPYRVPNVKIYEKDNATNKYETGYSFFRDVAQRRLSDVGLSLDDFFEPDALDLLIHKSGGLMRDFISLVKDSCTKAEINGLDKINLKAADEAVSDRAGFLGSGLTREALKELMEVYKTKWPSDSAISSELLHGLLIVSYLNRFVWFDAHPIIWDYL